jgi:hypothetical protein
MATNFSGDQQVSVGSDITLHHSALQSFEGPGWPNELGSWIT